MCIDFDDESNLPQTTLFTLLIEAGVDLPEPDDVSDADLHATLWNVINALADLGVYLSSTNHLSDRELYTLLVYETLYDDHPDVPEEFPVMTHIDLLSISSDAEFQVYLRYYADEVTRARY